MDTCERCGGDVELRLVRFCVCEANPMIVVENVPAEVCSQCGERSFTGETVDTLDVIRMGGVPPLLRPPSVRAFDYRSVHAGIILETVAWSAMTPTNISTAGQTTLDELGHLVAQVDNVREA